MRAPFGLLVATCLLLSGCVPRIAQPDEGQLQATITSIAASIYGTQTAGAPTSTITPKPTPEPTPSLSSTPTRVFDAMVNVSLLKVFTDPKISTNSIYEFSSLDGLTVIGRNRDCSWLEVVTPFGDTGWVNTQLERVSLNTPCESLPHGYWRPENGAIIFDLRESQGKGEITITNGLTQDSYIVLTDPGDKPILGCYIRSGSENLLKGIPDGNFYIFFATGETWDIVDFRFSESARYQKFQDMLAFTSTRTSYTTWELTLHRVEGGTAVTETLPPEEFPNVNE